MGSGWSELLTASGRRRSEPDGRCDSTQRYGSREQFGAIAVAQRDMGDDEPASAPMTMDDYLSSRCSGSSIAVRLERWHRRHRDVAATRSSGRQLRPGMGPKSPRGYLDAERRLPHCRCPRARGVAAIASIRMRAEHDVVEFYDCYTYTVLIT